MDEKTPADLGESIEDLAVVLRGLQGSASGLADEIQLVRKESQEARTAGRRARTMSAVGAAVASLVLVMASINFVVTRQDERETDERRAQTSALLEAIQACTSPGHECYDENQRRSNERLAPIVAIICKGVPPEERQPPCPRP